MINRLCHIVVGAVLLAALIVQAPAAALEAVQAPVATTAETPQSVATDEAVDQSIEDELNELNEPLEPQAVVEVHAEPVTSLQYDDEVENEVASPMHSVDQMTGIAPEPPVVEIPKPAPVITELLVNGSCTLSFPADRQIADCTSTTYKDVDYFELYNPSALPLPLKDIQIFYSRSGVLDMSQLPLTVFGDEEVAPHQSVILGRNVSSVLQARIAQFSQNLIQSGGSLYVTKGGAILDELAWGDAQTPGRVKAAQKPLPNEALQRCLVGDIPYESNPRDASLEFIRYTSDLLTPGQAVLCPPVDPEPSVNSCEGLKLSEISANVDKQYVEIYNDSDSTLDIMGCRLQTNRSQNFYSFTSRQLQSGEYAVVYIADTDLILTKTTTGTVYLLSSDGKIEQDSQSYVNLAKDTSWALFGDTWKQTYATTAGMVNRYQQYLPCEVGYERNEETGRCRKVEIVAVATDCGESKYRSEETGRCRNFAVESALSSCSDNQYRNPETNRCRNLTAAVSALTPCKEGQYRSPETNRCRSLVVTATSEQKPCAAGQERNPETNRCRKIVSGDGKAGFKVVDTPETADRMVSWLALGGVGAMSLGYAVWEWRRELIDGISKLVGLLPFVK